MLLLFSRPSGAVFLYATLVNPVMMKVVDEESFRDCAVSSRKQRVPVLYATYAFYTGKNRHGTCHSCQETFVVGVFVLVHIGLNCYM